MPYFVVCSGQLDFLRTNVRSRSALDMIEYVSPPLESSFWDIFGPYPHSFFSIAMSSIEPKVLILFSNQGMKTNETYKIYSEIPLGGIQSPLAILNVFRFIPFWNSMKILFVLRKKAKRSFGFIGNATKRCELLEKLLKA